MAVKLLITASALIWIIVLLLPWQPWRIREQFSSRQAKPQSLAHVTVLIPARNEADVIGSTLTGVRAQAADLRVIVIDDQSEDDTVAVASSAGLKHLEVIQAPSLPPGWSGKLWALEQGYQHATTRYILLLDADILLKRGVVAGLLEKLQDEHLQLISLMARLRMISGWEKLLMPAFIYFFKLLYPFALANRPGTRTAAAAGGCILLEKSALDGIGGLQSLRGTLIDDCTLAQRIKDNGGRTWLGLSHDAVSLRRYDSLTDIWQMVSRTAYTQLNYSLPLLFICLLLLFVSYLGPLLGLLYPGNLRWIALLTLAAMTVSYLPTLRYYDLPAWRALTLPLAASLFAAMTVDSARRHISGRGSQWKQRHYSEP